MLFDHLFRKNKNKDKEKERNPLCGDDRARILDMLQDMARGTQEALNGAMRALTERDDKLAQEVIDQDDIVDRLEVDVEQACLRFIAMRQPVRDDLRFVFTVLKIITDLERTADQAVNIAQRAQKLNRQSLLKPLVDIPKMASLCEGMLRDSLKAFVENDADLARGVFRRDDEVDRLNQQVFDEVVGLMAENPDRDDDYVRRSTDLILIARYLERTGDHACNIAERAYFMITGNRIKEDRPRKDLS